MTRIFTMLCAVALLQFGTGCKHVGGGCDCGPQPGEAVTYPAGGMVQGGMVQGGMIQGGMVDDGHVISDTIVSTGPGVPGGYTTSPATVIGSPMPNGNVISPAGTFEPLPNPPKAVGK